MERAARIVTQPPGGFYAVVPGDVITRDLAGAKMKLRVTDVDDRYIYCGPVDHGWKFCRRTGAEVDEACGWDENGTGSYIESVEERGV